MKITEKSNRDSIYNASESMGSLRNHQQSNSNESVSNNVCYRHSATNTYFGSYNSPKYLSFPMDLVVAPPFSNDLTKNLNYYFENECVNSLCKNRKWPYLHMDTISKMRLKSLIKSIYDDKYNSNLFKPPSCPYEEEAALSACPAKSRRKKKKCKKIKGCCCKTTSSLVSLHLDGPSGASGKKEFCCCKKTTKKKRRRSSNNERATCPYFVSNSVHEACPSVNNATKAIALTVGNQRIVISFENNPRAGIEAASREETRWQSRPSSRSCSRRRSPSCKSRSSSSTRNLPKTCDCLEKLKTKIAKNLIQLITNKVTNCNAKSKTTKPKTNSSTITSPTMSIYSFEMEMIENEPQRSSRQPATSPPSGHQRPKRSCGCGKKNSSKEDVKVRIKVSSNQLKKDESCCCKRCYNDKRKRNSSGTPPVEYVYLQEQHNGSSKCVLFEDSGSSSRNSRNDAFPYVDSCSNSSNERSCSQFHSNQGVFIQNEMTLSSPPIELSTKKIEMTEANTASKEFKSSRVRNGFIPFSTMSKGTLISESSEILFIENDCGLLSRTKKVANEDEESEYRNAEENTTKSKLKTNNNTENLDNSRKQHINCGRDEREKENFCGNRMAKYDYSNPSKCEDLEKLLVEIETYWQMSSSNSNVFGKQEKILTERKKEVNDSFVKSINDDLDDFDTCKNNKIDKIAEIVVKYLDCQSNMKIITKSKKSECTLPKKTSSKLSDLKISRKTKIKSLGRRSRITNENYIGFFLL